MIPVEKPFVKQNQLKRLITAAFLLTPWILSCCIRYAYTFSSIGNAAAENAH